MSIDAEVYAVACRVAGLAAEHNGTGDRAYAELTLDEIGVDSLGVFELINLLESEFDFRFDVRLLEPKSFLTIGSVVGAMRESGVNVQ